MEIEIHVLGYGIFTWKKNNISEIAAGTIKERIHKATTILMDIQHLYLEGNAEELADWCILRKGSKIKCVANLRGGAMPNVLLRSNSFDYARVNDDPVESASIKNSISSVKLACKSDALDGEADMVGMALWSYKDKTDWTLNGVHCKAGYVYLKKTANIQHFTSSQGQVHGKLYMSLFGCECRDVVASGFAIRKGRFEWNSVVFNTGTPYHNSDRAAGPVEQEIIKAIVHKKPGTILDIAEFDHSSYENSYVNMMKNVNLDSTGTTTTCATTATLSSTVAGYPSSPPSSQSLPPEQDKEKKVTKMYPSPQKILNSVELAKRRRDEMDFIMRNDSTSEEKWFLIDTQWLSKWKSFVVQNGPLPGPVNNDRLLCGPHQPRKGLEPVRHYRGVNEQQWMYWMKNYGGGPELKRMSVDLYAAEEGLQI